MKYPIAIAAGIAGSFFGMSNGRCFFRRLDGGIWVETEPVVRDPNEIYKPGR